MCRDLPDDLGDPMFADLPTSPNRPKIESAALLLPLLICERCPVRHECLTESLEPVWFTRREETEELAEVVSRQWVDGVWSGSLMLDRWALRHLPPAEAVDRLEASFAERLQIRIRGVLADAGEGLEEPAIRHRRRRPARRARRPRGTL